MCQNSNLISFFFYFNCLPDHVLFKIAVWADDTALNSSCDKPIDLSQQVEIAMSCNLILKYENTLTEISEDAILHSIVYWYLEIYSKFTS